MRADSELSDEKVRVIILLICICSILVLQFIVIGEWAGKHVALDGVVVYVRGGENYTLVTMDVNGELVKVYTPFRVNVNVGDAVHVEGSLNWYKGELEVKADTVR